MKRAVWAGIVVAVSLSGQEFEVATVKTVAEKDIGAVAHMPTFVAANMACKGGPGTKDPGRFECSKATLKILLAKAYGLKMHQISGPDWIDSEWYTITAKVPAEADAKGLEAMLQKLLTERFQLKLRREPKEMAVYRLRIAKNGPKLEPPEPPQPPMDEAQRAEAAKKQMAAMRAATEAGAQSGTRSRGSRWISSTSVSVTMAQFAAALTSNLDRPVKDMTQYEGKFSYHLRWNPDNGPSTNGDDDGGVSIFKALQDQMGLTLEAGKEPIEVMVVVGGEKVPVAN